MKRIKLFVSLALSEIIIFFSSGCNHEHEYVTIERTVNAVWSADNSEILKVVSTYETYNPSEKYYNAPSGRNWRYRFEICNTEMGDCKVVGGSEDIDQGGVLESVPVYWLPSVQKLVTWWPSVIRSMTGEIFPLDPPLSVINDIFVHTGGYYDGMDIAPSPNEDVIAVYFQGSYTTSPDITDISYDQCISFFDVNTGNHIFTQKIPWIKIYPLLNVINQDNNRRCLFLWSGDGKGVYLVTRAYSSYYIRYGENQGIIEVDSVPERGTITKGGKISQTGLYLDLIVSGNSTSVEIRQLENWKPFGSLGLIPTEENTYSFW